MSWCEYPPASPRNCISEARRSPFSRKGTVVLAGVSGGYFEHDIDGPLRDRSSIEPTGVIQLPRNDPSHGYRLGGYRVEKVAFPRNPQRIQVELHGSWPFAVHCSWR